MTSVRKISQRPKGVARWWPDPQLPGWITLLSCGGGWFMVRRPGCVPFCISAKEWELLPVDPPGHDGTE